MSNQPNTVYSTARPLASQRTYYDQRAEDYGDVSKPDRKGRSESNPELFRALIDELRPAGDVLELACGTGDFTAALARHAQSVTAVDASPHMLAINERRLKEIFMSGPGRFSSAAGSSLLAPGSSLLAPPVVPSAPLRSRANPLP